MTEPIVYYFGVARGQTGHYCYDRTYSCPNNYAVRTPWVDVPYAPLGEWAARLALYGTGNIKQNEQVEGVRHHVTDQGWTLLSWWDRSAHERHGSHSTFAIQGEYQADEAEAIARTAFPAVFQRMEKHLRQP